MKRYRLKLTVIPATITDCICNDTADVDFCKVTEFAYDQDLAVNPHIKAVEIDFSWPSSANPHPLFAICEEYGLDPTEIAEICREAAA
jgi:hypothetical protein